MSKITGTPNLLSWHRTMSGTHLGFYGTAAEATVLGRRGVWFWRVWLHSTELSTGSASTLREAKTAAEQHLRNTLRGTTENKEES